MLNQSQYLFTEQKAEDFVKTYLEIIFYSKIDTIMLKFWFKTQSFLDVYELGVSCPRAHSIIRLWTPIY